MKTDFYFLSPVQVVRVTKENLQEVAEWCGGKVEQTASRRVPNRMDSYVDVPTSKDSKSSWAFPGMFITRRLVITAQNETRSTWAVFRRDYFEKNYFSNPTLAVDETWEKDARKVQQAKRKPPKMDPRMFSEQPRVPLTQKIGETVKIQNPDGSGVIEGVMPGATDRPVLHSEVVINDNTPPPMPPKFKHEHAVAIPCDALECPSAGNAGIHQFEDTDVYVGAIGDTRYMDPYVGEVDTRQITEGP